MCKSTHLHVHAEYATAISRNDDVSTGSAKYYVAETSRTGARGIRQTDLILLPTYLPTCAMHEDDEI